MNRSEVYKLIDGERLKQSAMWSPEFDNANTPNDWVAYLAHELGEAVTLPWDGWTFRRALVKVAAVAVAILEREDYAPRHYDKSDRCFGFDELE